MHRSVEKTRIFKMHPILKLHVLKKENYFGTLILRDSIKTGCYLSFRLHRCYLTLRFRNNWENRAKINIDVTSSSFSSPPCRNVFRDRANSAKSCYVNITSEWESDNRVVRSTRTLCLSLVSERLLRFLLRESSKYQWEYRQKVPMRVGISRFTWLSRL